MCGQRAAYLPQLFLLDGVWGRTWLTLKVSAAPGALRFFTKAGLAVFHLIGGSCYTPRCLEDFLFDTPDIADFAAWAASGGRETRERGGGRRPPAFSESVWRPPGVAQTTNIDDVRFVKQSCIKHSAVLRNPVYMFCAANVPHTCHSCFC